jgi:hypothetical protein
MPTARTRKESLAYHARTVAALRTLARAPEGLGAGDRALFPRTKEALLDVLEDMRDELDDEVVLALVSGAERVLRLDYRARLDGSAAPAVRFKGLETKFGGRVQLEEVLDVWKDLADASKEAGRFKQMYVYRHGLAHGRYFNKSGLHEPPLERARQPLQRRGLPLREHPRRAAVTSAGAR